VKRSTEGLIALQFLAVALPIALVLVAQLAADARRADALARSRPLRNLASEARANYRTFTNGAADAVDTGTLGRQSAEALHNSATLLAQLAHQDPVAATGNAPGEIARLAGTVGKGASLTALLPMREAILRGDQLTRDVDARYTARDEGVVRDAVASAARQKRIVSVALLVSFALSTVFVLATRKRLKQQLEAEAAIERRLQSQLREASRHAGMAEVATSVLHNVGNVLNSVNVSASLVTDNLRRSKVAGLGRVVSLLQEHQHDIGQFIGHDERGRQLPAYLAGLSKHLLADQGETLQELDSLRRNIDHIKEIVAMQQSYAKLAGVSETVVPSELVEECLRISAADFDEHAITLVREFEPVPEISVDRHKVLQILVNLLRNAKHACQKTGLATHCVVIGLATASDGIRISVGDDGVGIAPDHMTRIFHYGFTTKQEGHGFGLHGSALAAREMGGSLHAASDGPGLGATFTLQLPLHPPGAANG
jgi:signal transduction histidine kinase